MNLYILLYLFCWILLELYLMYRVLLLFFRCCIDLDNFNRNFICFLFRLDLCLELLALFCLVLLCRGNLLSHLSWRLVSLLCNVVVGLNRLSCVFGLCLGSWILGCYGSIWIPHFELSCLITDWIEGSFPSLGRASIRGIPVLLLQICLLCCRCPYHQNILLCWWSCSSLLKPSHWSPHYLW